jgi:hypothetical protein
VQAEESSWVTSTDLHAPGHLQLEVITTDSTGESTSERFWVDIPEPPPPPAPGTSIPPRFHEIAEFREDYGLEVVFPVANETELNERIFDLIKAWHEPNTPLGEVARSSRERWGVPLRPADVAELEYREGYVATNGPLIEDWAYTHALNTYAGYEVDHRSGGIIRVGFTGEEQEERVAELLAQVSLAAPERVGTFQTTPKRARLSLEELEEQVADAIANDSILSPIVAEVGVTDSANVVEVSATNVVQAEQRLVQLVGSLDGIDVVFEPELPKPQLDRNRITGRMLAGDRILTQWADNVRTNCTAGFGAYEDRPVGRIRFLLTSGHCAHLDQKFYRASGNQHPELEPKSNWREIGHVTRNPYWVGPPFTDILAMRFHSDGLAPRHYHGHEGALPPIESPVVARRGQRLCVSGAVSDRVKCGKVVGIKHIYIDDLHRRHGLIKVEGLNTADGDSGAPVWNARTRKVVGLLFGGYEIAKMRFVQPLLDTPTGRGRSIRGGLKAPEMYDLHIITGD